MARFLSEKDHAVLAEMMDWWTKQSINPGKPQDFLDREELSSPETYVAKAPSAGIPAITGSDKPGTARCAVYRRLPSGVLRPVEGIYRIVNNLNSSAIAADSLALVQRDKWGDWFVIAPPGGATDTIWKAKIARVATTANITISNPASSFIDGVTVNSGDLVLVKDQTTSSQNGLYTFNGAGVAMTRTSDFDSMADMAGAVVRVSEGVSHMDTEWTCVNDSGGSFPPTSIYFVKTGEHGVINESVSGTTITTTLPSYQTLNIAGVANSLTIPDIGVGRTAVYYFYWKAKGSLAVGTGAVPCSLACSINGTGFTTTPGAILQGSTTGNVCLLQNSAITVQDYGGVGHLFTVNQSGSPMTIYLQAAKSDANSVASISYMQLGFFKVR